MRGLKAKLHVKVEIKIIKIEWQLWTKTKFDYEIVDKNVFKAFKIIIQLSKFPSKTGLMKGIRHPRAECQFN